MSISETSEAQQNPSRKFQSADEMVLSIVKPGGEVKVAACTAAVEEKTKLIVQVVIIVAVFIAFLVIDIDPYFIVIPIALVELAYLAYVVVMGGADAIIIQKTDNTSRWGEKMYVIKGVSHDKQSQEVSYDSVYELRRGSMEKKFSLSPLGGFKFKHGETTFTLIGTMSNNRRNIYKNGMVSLGDIHRLLYASI